MRYQQAHTAASHAVTDAIRVCCADAVISDVLDALEPLSRRLHGIRESVEEHGGAYPDDADVLAGVLRYIATPDGLAGALKQLGRTCQA